MAKLKAVIPSLDAVPEAVREFYVPTEGGFALDTDGVEEIRKTVVEQETAYAARVAEHTAREALKAAGADVDLMVPHVVKALKVERRGTDFTVAVIGPDAKPRVRDERGTPMDVGDLIRELKADTAFGRGFKGVQASGSGMLPSGPTFPTPGTVLRLSRAAAQDARVYREAKARAEREGLRLEIEPG